MDKLKIRLETIEEKIGGTETQPLFVDDALDWHLRKIENLIEESSSQAGGTKLYNHTLRLSNGHTTFTYTIISNKELPYTGNKNVKELFMEAILFINNTGTKVDFLNCLGPSDMITLDNGSTGFAYVFYTISGMNTVEGHYEATYAGTNFSGNAFVSDTVTEL